MDTGDAGRDDGRHLCQGFLLIEGAILQAQIEFGITIEQQDRHDHNFCPFMRDQPPTPLDVMEPHVGSRPPNLTRSPQYWRLRCGWSQPSSTGASRPRVPRRTQAIRLDAEGLEGASEMWISTRCLAVLEGTKLWQYFLHRSYRRDRCPDCQTMSILRGGSSKPTVIWGMSDATTESSFWLDRS
jgi:hypothetical protein